ncbi:TPA: MGMT family protein [Candidatus Micrarchaeota archaeon]|nr:MGMT family protein [Candidatus Micrarchaeota archaeon]
MAREKPSQLQKDVFKATAKIPRGKISTYALVAEAIGKPRAARAVGNALNKSSGMPSCPCHRVVKSDGSVGGFTGGTRRKIFLLRKEGLEITSGNVSGFENHLYKFR